MVDVPVVAAARLKGHVVYPHLAGGQGVQVAPAHEIPGEAVVGRPDGEHHLPLVAGHVVPGGVLRPHLLGHAEGRPGLGPAGVKGRVGQDLGDLLPGDAVLPGGGEVVLEGAVHQALGHQGYHRHQGAVPEGELLLPAPHLAEEHVVIELREFGGERPQGLPARRLLHCHVNDLLFQKR